MAGRIARSFIEQLVARADVVELIGSRVTLKKAGREYKACCPFHDEKTPSFWVSPEKQFYHCFGCGAHGNALDFLMQYDRLPFPEAVEDLATRLGLPVVYEAGTPAGGPAAAQDAAAAEAEFALYRVLAQAAEHFHANLAASPRARAYARQRGLDEAILERFGIGYAADSWNDLLRRFDRADAQRALTAAGLIVAHEGAAGPGTPAAARHYDRFRDRLMFPIRDHRGRVIGFGGRVLGSGEPKYLNSPETALFHKGRELYGLYETRLARVNLRRLLLVEGYMDVVQLHQHGLTAAVATLGTATTPEHVRRAFRLVSELVFAFDGDRAGRAAAWRALQQVLPEARAGREVRFLFLPEGEDPDSLVRREGRDAFEARLSGALPLSEYLVEHLSAECDLQHADGKARFIAAVRPLVERVAPGVYRELLIERIAAALQVAPERLQQWLVSATAPVPAAVTGTMKPTASAGTPSRRPAGGVRGRGSLVTQAIGLTLHFPAAAAAIPAEARAALARLTEAGTPVLSRLIEEQAAEPAATLAQALERWRDRHEYRRLCELAAHPPLAPDAQAAGRELSEAVRRLIDRELRSRRLQALIDKAAKEPLDGAEKLELQALTVDQRADGGSAPAERPAGRPGGSISGSSRGPVGR